MSLFHCLFSYLLLLSSAAPRGCKRRMIELSHATIFSLNLYLNKAPRIRFIRAIFTVYEVMCEATGSSPRTER